MKAIASSNCLCSFQAGFFSLVLDYNFIFFTEKAVKGANSKVYSEKKQVVDYIYCHIKSLDRAAPDLVRCPVSSSRAVEDPGNNRGEEKR